MREDAGFESPDADGNPYFDIKKYRNWVQYLNVSPGSYREDQVLGLQAAMAAEVLRGSVRVSREEALADFLYDNDTVEYSVVAFDAQRYREKMKLTDADLKRFEDEHASELEARFKTDAQTYKDTKPQVHVREIFIPKLYDAPAPAGDDKKPDDKKAPAADNKAPAGDKTAKADDKKAPAADSKAPAGDNKAPAGDKAAKADDKKPEAPANPRGLPIEAGKAKLEAVRAQIAAGKLKFTDAEKQLAADSSDDAPLQNGDRGWRSVAALGFEDKALTDAVATLKPGELTQVITTDRGAYLATVTDKREGNLTFDQVKDELAENMAKDMWSKEAAKREALAALTAAQGKNLSDLFTISPPPFDLRKMLKDPKTPEKQKQMIRQLMEQQKQQGGAHGSTDVHETDVPVGWFADADGPSGSSGSSAAAPAGSATPAAPAAAGSAAPAAAGSAAPAAGAGSAAAPAGAGSAGTPAAPAAKADAAIEATKDVLPTITVDKPHGSQYSAAPREATMQGIGASKTAANALFDELKPGEVAKRLYESEDAYFLIQLIAHNHPDVAEFDKTADETIAALRDARGKAALAGWLVDRCQTLTKANKIKAAPDRVRETDDKGNPIPTQYHPCMYLDQLTR
jgi:parvulin-like peptidyl-prolyl isomerase